MSDTPSSGTPGAMHIRPGDVLNGMFEVKRFLARGGMGEVYEGVNVTTQERVAIKVVLPELTANEKVMAMFHKEAKALEDLSHPALVQYRVLAKEPTLGLYYIVTGFIDGKNLADVLGSLGPTTPEVMALARRLADGLRVAHAKGVVHRDLSPDNIILEGGRIERARIIDFGIAKDLDPDNKTIVGDGFAGKLGFVAPEQLGAFKRDVGAWSDVYSLALVILSILRGANVNMGTNLVEAVEMRQQVPDLSDVPGELRALLQGMLVPNPAARVRSMDEVVASIDRNSQQRTLFAPPMTVFEPGGISASPPPPPPAAPRASPPPPPPPPPAAAPAAGSVYSPPPATHSQTHFENHSRSKMPLIAGGAAAALVLAGGAWWALSNGGSPSTIAGVVAESQCAWLNVDRSDSSKIMVGGAAQNPGVVRDMLMKAKEAEGISGDIDTNYLAPVDQGACGVLDALKPIRTSDPLLKAEQLQYEMRVGGNSNNPSVLAAKSKIIAQLPSSGAKFIVYGVESDGKVGPALNSASLADVEAAGIARRVDDRTIELNLPWELRASWTGLLILSGSGSFAPAETNNPTPVSASDGSLEKLVSDAKAAGWKADMVWTHFVDETPG